MQQPRKAKRRDSVIKAFEVIAVKGRHVTVDELFDRTRKIDPQIGYTTVWRTLKLLMERGLASAQKFNDGFTRYEYIKKEEHHDHMICIKCGGVEEFLNPAVEKLQVQAANSHGFVITSHKMELYGYCKRCKK